MESTINSLEDLFERVEAYGKTTLELTKLKVLERSILVVTAMISRLGVLLMLSLATIVFTIGAALFLGDLLGKSYYGFFIVAAFYLVLGIILHFFLHGWIKKPMSELIISEVLN